MGDSTTDGERRVEYEAAKWNAMQTLRIRVIGPVDGEVISMIEKLNKIGKMQDECPACHGKFKAGDAIIGQPLQAWGDRGPSDINLRTILIHEMCFFPFGGDE